MVPALGGLNTFKPPGRRRSIINHRLSPAVASCPGLDIARPPAPDMLLRRVAIGDQRPNRSRSSDASRNFAFLPIPADPHQICLERKEIVLHTVAKCSKLLRVPISLEKARWHRSIEFPSTYQQKNTKSYLPYRNGTEFRWLGLGRKP